MAENRRPMHSCQVHPFAAEALARDRWQELVRLAQAPQRRRLDRMLLQKLGQRVRHTGRILHLQPVVETLELDDL